MRKHRKLLISSLLLLSVAIATGLWLIRRGILPAVVRALPGQGPPPAVRILPEGDLLFYADLRLVHLAAWRQSNPVQLEGDYQQFVDQTGIQLERDLDEVGMSRRDAAQGGDVESSEILKGHFDRSRLSAYLRRISSQTEDYRGLTIYSIPNQGHTVRVSVLDDSTVAVTNMISPDPMRGIIDGKQQGVRRRPSLLDEYFGRVPLGSLAWMIDRVPKSSDAPQLPGGLSFGFLENTVAVVSLRYTDTLLLRADVIAPGEAEARRVTESANASLLMYRSVAQSLGSRGSDPDVKAAVDSVRVQQNGRVTTFTAELSNRFLKKILMEAQPQATTVAPSPSPVPVPRARNRKR
jgi:hypothetical protein